MNPFQPFYVHHKDGYFVGVVDRIRMAENGYVDLVVTHLHDANRRMSAGWWCWWGDGVHSVEGFLHRLKSVPGWTPEIEAAILAHRATRAPAGWDGQSSEATGVPVGRSGGPTLTGRYHSG